MLPCQKNCQNYHSACHKSCVQWKQFQAQQEVSRQAKKRYLQYYNQLCAEITRQFRGMNPVFASR